MLGHARGWKLAPTILTGTRCALVNSGKVAAFNQLDADVAVMFGAESRAAARRHAKAAK